MLPERQWLRVVVLDDEARSQCYHFRELILAKSFCPG